MAVMMPRESWTDDRLDDLNDRVAEGFRRNDEEFRALRSAMNSRFDVVDARFGKVDARLDGMQRAMVQATIAMATVMLTGFVGLAGLILTQS